MSFLKNLTKGFVRSAVNQVGRDGGKVISNTVYGNKHSSPVRGSFEASSQNTYFNQNTIIENRGDLTEAGYSTELLGSPIWAYLFLIIGSMILPIIGPVYWLISAIRNLFKSRIRMYIYSLEPTYVKDRRYSSGVRESGSKKIKKYTTDSFPLNQSEKIVFISKGLLALLLAGAIFYFQYTVYKAFKEADQAEIKSNY